MTDLNELLFFTHVAETGSFTAAAAQLSVPKSTVSRGISRLEQRLGVRLLERSTRHVSLTEPGETFLQYCRAAMDEIEQAELVVSALREIPKGRLAIGAPPLFVRSSLAPLLGDFLERYPEIQLHLTTRNACSDALGTNVDLVIRTGPVEDSGLFVKLLGHVRYGIFATPKYLSRFGDPAMPCELEHHACITTGESVTHKTWRLRSDGKVVEVRVDSRASAGDSGVLLQLALGGAGIAALPCWLAHQHLVQGCLRRVLPSWELDSMSVYAVYRSRMENAPKIRAFLEFITERLTLE